MQKYHQYFYTKFKRETCPPGVSSCSSVVYFSRKGDPQVAHTRKFCTTLHTELTDDVLSNSSSQQQNRSTTPPSLCQNIAQWVSYYYYYYDYSSQLCLFKYFVFCIFLSNLQRLILRCQFIYSLTTDIIYP
jgi:hypothetical protein